MKTKTPKARNYVAIAMRKRHPRAKAMAGRNKRRQKDARNSWRRDHGVG